VRSQRLLAVRAACYIYFYKDVCSCSTDLCGGVPDGGEGQGTGRRPTKPEKRPKNGSFYGFYDDDG